MSDRSPNTDALALLGKIITSNEKRDAIHLAVIATCAHRTLMAGEDVGVLGKFSSDENPIGIVDPFLALNVGAGEWFWLIIYPRQITSLRHVWTHPDVPDDEEYQSDETVTVEMPNKESMQYLETAAATLGTDYDELIQMCDNYAQNGHIPCFGHDLDYSVNTRSVLMHYGVVKGIKITYEQAENFYFRCAC